VGSVVTIRWHREQFAAVARNCRQDGRDFLVGVRREPATRLASSGGATGKSRITASNGMQTKAAEATQDHPLLRALQAERTRRECQSTDAASPVDRQAGQGTRSRIASPEALPVTRNSAVAGTHMQCSESRSTSDNSGAFPRLERKDMQPKSLFPNFWRRAKEQDRPQPANPKEVLVNKPLPPVAGTGSARPQEMLSYDDIYHAAGIMNPASGYGIPKVVEMLNSQRIRDLSKEVKRASVLMALDAAGSSVEQVLCDATRRQEALNSYESSKKKQLEEFEAAKTRENSQIEQEMERVRAHYAERIEHNRDVIGQEKESLRNWQMAMQHELQRIAEVIELCGKQPQGVAAAGSDKPALSEPEQARAAASGRSG
jgi:hypothetical protein